MKGRIAVLAFTAMLLCAIGLAGCASDQPTDAPSTASPDTSSAPNSQASSPEASKTEGRTMNVNINGTAFTATLADNTSAEALAELLADGPKTYTLQDYGGMEKVGSLGTNRPSTTSKSAPKRAISSSTKAACS